MKCEVGEPVTIVAASRGDLKSMGVWVGIDVGAKHVDMVYRHAGRASKAERYEQTPQGHRLLVKRLRGLEPERVVLEATGIYYLDLAVALADAGLSLSVINPKSSRHFAELKLQSSKTDPIDAALLAEYGERMTPQLWTAPDTVRLSLRSVGRQINRLIGARTQAKNRLHALQATRGTLSLLIEDEQEGIDLLDRRIERLRRAAEEILESAPELLRMKQHMSAAKGVADATALALLAELCVLPQHLKSGQVSRHAGLDVRLYQSGSSVNRPARISKAGNAYIRAALYMPVMSAVRHDPNARAFYEALVGRGKKKMQAQCAVMRKYLTGLWACIQTDTPFDSSRLFSDCHMQKA